MLSTSAIAVEIENQDGQDYKVNTWERKDGGAFGTVTIPAGKSAKVCNMACVITIDGPNNESVMTDQEDAKLIIKSKKLQPRG